jgi:glycosyltransferase involved in cell wall biosynthesis
MFKKILIVLPVYNEEKILEYSVLEVEKYCKKNLNSYDWKIVIAENGSQDKSLEIIQEIHYKYPHILFFHLEKEGRGRALKKAWMEYDADIYVYMDIDLSTDLSYLLNLIHPLDKGECDIVIGSRLINGAQAKRSLKRKIISHFYNFLLRFFFPHYPVKDSQCGFKAISQKVKKEILPYVKNSNWFFDTELLVKAFYYNFKIKEIPVLWKESVFSERKSKVKLLSTIFDNLKEIIRLKKDLIKNRKILKY